MAITNRRTARNVRHRSHLVILRSPATKDLLLVHGADSRSFASLRMTWSETGSTSPLHEVFRSAVSYRVQEDAEARLAD
jgi:hypothetical protein